MRTTLLLASLAQAAFLRREPHKCAEKVNFDGIGLVFDERNQFYTGEDVNAKLAKSTEDKTWMFLSVLAPPLVSFDQADCVEDTKTWFKLGTDGYQPVNLIITKNA